MSLWNLSAKRALWQSVEWGTVITREPWPDADQGCLRADGSAQEENEILQCWGVIQIYFSYIYMMQLSIKASIPWDTISKTG